MKRNNEDRTLTRAEMEIMNILWDSKESMTTHAIIEKYPEPKPAYSTIATFLKILTNKQFVGSKKKDGEKTFLFRPLITREEYTKRTMKEVKNTFFGGSLKSLISFFAKEEDMTDDEINEILDIINRTK
ncbi:MAG: BlaI/MecI/CopY family transcriptional regulator [Bacteroidaceae bacterium]|nr:BlaI/MecI/CopY family transcriptional regulator [Bacteroidaceae bacterium]